MSTIEFLKLYDETDETWWFHIGRRYGCLRVEYPDGAGELEQAPYSTDWWSGPVDTDELIEVRQHREPLGVVELRDPAMESEALPLTMTREKYDELDDEGPVHALYATAYAEPVEKPVAIDISGAVVLHGKPLDRSIIPAGATWLGTLPQVLRYHNQYSHLFPGRLTGFREAVKTTLDAMPGVDAYTESGGLKGWVRVAYPDLFSGMPQRMKKKSPRSQKMVPDPRSQYTSIRWTLSLGDAIEGENLEAAAERWHKRADDIAAWFVAVQARAAELVAALPVPGVEVPDMPAGMKLRRD